MVALVTETLSQRVARLKAEAKATEPEQPSFDADLVPDLEPSTYERTEVDEEIDGIIDGIDILDAYAMWCGKMSPKVGSKRESVMISCPIPGHVDRNPSAWINLDKQTWFCGACDQGGDKIDIAAYHFGFPVPGYKEGKSFPELRKRIAEDSGLIIKRTPSGQTYTERAQQSESNPPSATPAEEITKTDSDSSSLSPFGAKVRALKSVQTGESAVSATNAVAPLAPVPDEPEIASSPTSGDGAVVVAFPTAVIETEDEVEYPSIDWRKMLTGDTFLSRFMNITSHDDLPEEFYFWLGLTAVGFTVGRTTVLADAPPVTGNLFVCLFGKSGLGKSRSTKILSSLLTQATPYDHDDPNSTGTYMVPSPGSAEALIDSFSRPIPDPADPKKVAHYGHVRGLIRFDELSTLTGRGSRAGSTMKPTLMEFYDGYDRVELRSRGHGHVVADQPYASAVTTTQPRAIRSLLAQTDADSGFVNRWIFACGPRKPKVSFGRKALDIRPCIDPLREIRAWASRIREVTMTRAALAHWDGFFHGVIEPARNSLDETLLTRTDLHLKKIMLLLALDRHEPEVSLETCMDAVSMWDYLRKSYGLLAGEIGMGELEDARLAVTTAIERYQAKYKKGISRRELVANLRNARIPLDSISRVIQLMVGLGEIDEQVIKPTAGKTTIRYLMASGD